MGQIREFFHQLGLGHHETPSDGLSAMAGLIKETNALTIPQVLPSPGKPQPATTPPSESSIAPSDPQDILWDRAYDNLKEEDPKLMKAYERILSSHLENGPEANPTGTQKNIVEQNDKNKRRRQMNRLIDSGRKRISKEAKIKENISTVTDAILATKSVITAAVENVPQAALAWSSVCVALEFLINPIETTKTHISGIKKVVQIMTKIQALSGDLFKKSPETDSLTHVQQELETQAVHIFKEILKYQANSICALYRNRGVAFLRDMIQLDEWDTNLTAIKDLEDYFVQFTQMYSSRQIVHSTNQMTELMRKQEERKLSKEDRECMQALSQIDAYLEKNRIERTKGYLLKDSYRWILDNPEFIQWRDGSTEDVANRLLWLKGGAGRGKTMLLCGIINELKIAAPARPLSFFLCQATDERINSYTAVLRGLIRLLVKEQPWLMLHVREKYDGLGKSVFESPSAWDALSGILESMLQDQKFQSTIIAIDALDECVQELPQLLDLVVDFSKKYSCVKWIVTSRNEPIIATKLESTDHLSLEIDARLISEAVDAYIAFMVKRIHPLKDRPEIRNRVYQAIHDKADDTFLWAALVFQELNKIRFPNASELLRMIKTIPSGLTAFYGHMMETICKHNEEGQKQCYAIIATALLARRPLHLLELANLATDSVPDSEDPDRKALGLENFGSGEDYTVNSMEDRVNKCGSFLVIRDHTVYFVHQSAKDFLTKDQAYTTVFPSGTETVHYNILSRSLECMRKTLHRDIYGLSHPGISIHDIVYPNPDPLVPVAYACVYWADHFCDAKKEQQPLGEAAVQKFLETSFLYWLEALSLLRAIPEGAAAMRKLKGSHTEEELASLILDAYRFTCLHRWLIENHPLQTYVSALLFTPTHSKIRKLFADKEPSWITVKPAVQEDWSAHLTLRGHKSVVLSVSISRDGLYIASASTDHTLRIWEVSSGNCIRVLKGRDDADDEDDDVMVLVVFSPDGKRLASLTKRFAQVWEVTSGECIKEMVNGAESNYIWFSPDGHCFFCTWRNDDEDKDKHEDENITDNAYIDIWDLYSGEIVKRFPQRHESDYDRLFCSASGKKIVSSLEKGSVHIWDLSSNRSSQLRDCTELLCVAFTPSDHQIATSEESCVKIWNTTTGICMRELEGPNKVVSGLVFLASETQLASCSFDGCVKIWNTDTGECTRTFYSDEGNACSLAYFQPNNLLVTGSGPCVLIWDLNNTAQTRQRDTNNGEALSVFFSANGKYLAFEAEKRLEVWDTVLDTCVETLKPINGDSFPGKLAFSPMDDVLAYELSNKGVALWDVALKKCTQTLHEDSWCRCLIFSSDGKRLAVEIKQTVHIWDTSSGTCLWKTDIFESETYSVSFAENLETFATCDWRNDYVRVYNSITGLCTRELSVTRPRKVELSADAKLVAIDSREYLWIWDMESPPREISRTDVMTSDFMGFSADNDCLIGAYDDEIRIYSISDGTKARIAIPSGNPIRSPNGVRIDSDRLLLDRGYVHFARSAKEDTLEEARWLDYGVDEGGSWITLYGQNVLWLPSRYESDYHQVRGLTIGICSFSGQNAVIRFPPDRSTWPLQATEEVE